MAVIGPATARHSCDFCPSALLVHSNAFASTVRASLAVLGCTKFWFGRRYSISRVAQSPYPITQLPNKHAIAEPILVFDFGGAKLLLQRRYNLSILARSRNLGYSPWRMGIQASLVPFALEEVDICSPELMLETMAFLQEDLPHLFDEQGIDKSRYEKHVQFRDPLTRFDTLDGYLFNIKMLRFLFAPIFYLHKVTQTGPNEITTRWTMTMNFVLLPWRPQLVFTGTSVMVVNPKTGKFLSHVDFWDSIKQNEYFSFEAVVDLLKQMRYYKTPDLEQPRYLVLKRTAEYEIRKYEPFIVVEAQGDGVTGLKGFNDVVGLPAPLSSKVELQDIPGAIMAAKKFSGPASEDALVENERRLRSALSQDGLNAKEGLMVAQYNDPGQTWKYVMMTLGICHVNREMRSCFH